MRAASRCLTALGFAATLGLASCADDPMSPIPTGGPDLQVVPVQPAGEEIYLSDELEDNDPALAPEFNGGLLFQVQLDDATSRANLTLIADLRGACAANLPAGVDCDVAFDKPHIGATPDGARVYVINRFVPNRPQDQGIYSGTPLGYYDVATGQFVYAGEIPGLPLEGSVLAANSPTGELYVANAQSNRLYRINATTLAIEASWPIVKSTGGTLDVVGADIAFDAAGTLYLWTNTVANGGADRGLYTVAIPAMDGADAIATRIGTNSTSFFTGLAIREAGTGNLLGSSESDNAIFAIDQADGSLGTQFDMFLGGAPFDHRYGDMTTGRILPPIGICEGGVSKLVLKYIGTDPLAGEVRGQRRNPGPSAILPAQVTGFGSGTRYTFAVTTLGGLFDPVANGRLANNFKIFIGDTQVDDIHTSCSQPIFPGMVIAGGLFEITEVHSVTGGQIGPP